MRGHGDLRAVVIVAVVLAALALVVPLGWLSLLLLAPLAFFLTGYAILLAAFVEGPQPWPRAFWISLGLSLAVLALLPLPLNYLGGLTPATWAIALALVVLVAAAIAAARRPADWTGTSLAALRPPPVSPLAAACGLAALALAAGAIVLAQVPLSNSKAEGFSELWMRPGPGGASVRVGVGNEEQRRTAYEVRAKFAGGREVTRSLTLSPGETSTLRFAVIPPGTLANAAFVSVLLFRRAEPDLPYRRVYGWIPAGTQ
ncbi:MAG: DUF1616 domain-containing protein [Actinobacteria bacterium]|nr:DUF1616 domain-containing protein [Actinomycetota bacterium]